MQEGEDRLGARPPTSGVILGVLVDAIGQRPPALTNKQASRYFHGDPSVSPEERQRVIEAIAQWVVRLNLLPVPQSLGSREPMPALDELLAMALRWHADQWDGLSAYVYSRAARAPDLATVLEPYLRLATIDLAIRAASLLWMVGVDSPQPEIPSWAKERGTAVMLKSFLAKAGVTRDKLAEAAGVEPQSADGWLDKGSRPEEKRFEGIGRVLSSGLGEAEPEQIADQLRRAYVLSAACNRLVSLVGRPTVEVLAGSLAIFTDIAMRALRPGTASQESETAMVMNLFLFGSRSPLAPGMLRLFWEHQGDAEWRLAAQAAGLDWSVYVQHRLMASGSFELVGPAVEMQRPTREAFDALHNLSEELIDACANQDLPRMFAAIGKQREVLEAVLATNPGDAWLHMQFGSLEGKFGDAHKGIQECWNAAKIEEGWELPLVEIGIIHLNSGEPEKARDHLEQVAAQREDHSWHLLYNLGEARFRCGDIGGALGALNRAITLNPVHKDMLDRAAHCAFLTRDHVMGRRLMNQARLLGTSETYKRWQRGEYRKRR